MGELETVLRRGFAEMSLPCGEDTLARFRRYYELLTERNRVMNLTAVSGETDTATKHFLDSAVPLLHFDLSGASVVDVGSGAGFPGLVLKLLCPSLRLTLLDSQGKRVEFLRETCAALGLTDVQCVRARAEEAAELRERFDYAVSRAVARLDLLCELCLPLVAPGGAFLALKGAAAGEEAAEASRAVRLLGGREAELFEAAVPGEEGRRALVCVRKAVSTPARYPRPFAQMKKSPL